MADNLIDRLAKLIDPEAFGLPAHVPSDGSDYLSDRDEARDKVRVILAAIRVPTEAMMTAGNAHTGYDGGEDRIWTAMIDLALKEQSSAG